MIDTVDLIIRHRPLAEIDGLVQADEEILSTMAEDDKLHPYFQERLSTHKMAQEIAGWCFENNIPTVGMSPQTKEMERGLYALEKCKELESKLSEIKENQRNFQTYILDKMNTKKKNRYKKYIS